MNKETYNGLSTKRSAVECAPLMDTSENVNLKVRTDISNTTQGWVVDDPQTPLQTSITSEFSN